MNHKLALEIPDTLNTKILRIEDYSDYSENVPIECQKLEVTCPGFFEPVVITDLEPGFIVNLTACKLGLQLYDCDINQLSIPDGVYSVRYSLSPSSQVNVEYKYLKASSLLQKYREILCSIPLDGTQPDEDTEAQLKLLNEIKTYIEAAKIKVETCHDVNKGMNLYNYAKTLLGKFNCSNC